MQRGIFTLCLERTSDKIQNITHGASLLVEIIQVFRVIYLWSLYKRTSLKHPHIVVQLQCIIGYFR